MSGRLGSMPRSRVLGSSCGYSACSQSSNNSGELASLFRIHFFSSLPFLGFSGSAPSANEACGFASIFRLKVSGNSRHLLFQKIVRTAPHRTEKDGTRLELLSALESGGNPRHLLSQKIVRTAPHRTERTAPHCTDPLP